MTRSYKKQPNDSIHDPIPFTFVEWMHQAHTEHNTSLAEGWEQYRQASRESLREAMEKKRKKLEQVTNQPEPRYDEVYYEGLAWLDDLEDTGDVTVYHSMLDDWPPGEESIESDGLDTCFEEEEQAPENPQQEYYPFLGEPISADPPSDAGPEWEQGSSVWLSPYGPGMKG